jgi:opacity protein-like surface antigen
MMPGEGLRNAITLLPAVAVMLLYICMTFAGRASGAEFGDIELDFYALGSWPVDKPIFNQGTTVEASVKHGFGGGVKVGLFPDLTRRIVGLEIDSSGHGGALSFADRSNGGQPGISRSDLLVLHTMINLVVRYPGERILPYVGIGGGWSHGILLNPNIAGRADQDFEAARSFAYQFLAGTQVMLSKKVFLFGEYRYFSADYHWNSLALDFRSHYGVAGFGLRF